MAATKQRRRRSYPAILVLLAGAGSYPAILVQPARYTLRLPLRPRFTAGGLGDAAAAPPPPRPDAPRPAAAATAAAPGAGPGDSASSDAALLLAAQRAEREVATLTQIDALSRAIALQELKLEALTRELAPPAQLRLLLQRATRPVRSSLGVLLRQVGRKRDLWRFLTSQTLISARVLADLTLGNYGSGLFDVLPHSRRLVVHTPAIYAHIDKLARHVPGILPILDSNLHLIEPHLDAILERFDDIEPHLPWVLEHIDQLAPFCGELLLHIDSLLLYADRPTPAADDAADAAAADAGAGAAVGAAERPYGWADKLLPYVPYIVPHLSELEAHLPYLRPHLDKIYPHLPRLARYIPQFARHSICSKNADVLVWWFGWVLHVPLLHHVFRVPGVPPLCAWAAGWLPRRWARGGLCSGVECSVEGLYERESGWNRLLPEDDARWPGLDRLQS